MQPKHCGIIICSEDNNWQQQAKRVNDAIAVLETLNGQIIRVKRPQK
ncbi:MAG: hypothetical protein F6K40_20615 [Okeania sp. SIO3I5]|nr:hypothetical protein [Okeania sp. SIO3I5]NEQ38541.1 hypothetical protein [Okeania sp. SIO3I5]